MSKRYGGTLALAAMLVAGILLAPRSASAQQQQQDYYTYVSRWAVPRAQWNAFAQEQQAEIPTLKKLVADGTLVAWGNAAVRVHQEDGYTHAEWITATSRENLLKALETEWMSATNASFVSATKHTDLLLHTLAHGGKTVTDATGYLRVATYHAKPGDEDALRGFILLAVKPMLDSAVADGTLLMYNLDEEDIHTAAPGVYNFAMFFPDGAAMDKFFSNLAAGMKSDPSAAQILAGLTVGQDHRDSFFRVTAYQHR